MDTCLRYLGARPVTPLRQKMLIKCMQIKSAYYSTYRLDIDSLIHYSRQALALAEGYPDADLHVICLGNLADAYKQGGMLDLSADCYNRAIFLADSVGFRPQDYIFLYEGLASTFTDLRDFQSSRLWWDKAWALRRHMTKQDLSIYYNNRGNDYYYQKNYPASLHMFQLLDSLLDTYPSSPWERAYCHANMADLYLRLGQPEKARPLLDAPLAVFSEMNAETELSYVYTQLLELARQENDPAAAERVIRLHPLPKGSKPAQTLLRQEALAKYYSTLGDWQRAFRFQHDYFTLSDSLRGERVKRLVEVRRLEYERDTTLLRQRVAIREAKARIVAGYGWLSLVVTALLVMAVAFYVRHRQGKSREARLFRKLTELRMENVRNRITPHFIYNVLNHELLAQQQGKPTRLDTVVRLLRQEQAVAQEFCISLREELAFIELYAGIEGETLPGGLSYAVEMDRDIDADAVFLPSMTLQIFVENAIKHGLKGYSFQPGERAELRITVRAEEGQTAIEVRNNGRPFLRAQQENATGTGLKVISQTIFMLNQHNKRPMRYELRPDNEEKGSGCRATLTIPQDYDFNFPARKKQRATC